MPRLFVAIDLPESVKRQLAGLRTDLPGARWVPPEQVHLTLRFIGMVDQRLFIAIRDHLADIHLSSFPVAFGGIGTFPVQGACRVLWVGVEQSPALIKLHQLIEDAVVAAGAAAENRTYSPHITVARFNDASRDVVARIQTNPSGYEGGIFMVHEFQVYSSILNREGSRHTVEAVYSLS